MTNSIRIVDGATSVWLRPPTPSASDAIICASSELPLAAPRVVGQQRVGRSGVTDLTSLHDSTTFRCRLLVRNDAVGSLGTRHQIADLLRSLTAAHKRPFLYIQRDGWSGERRAELRGDSASYVVDKISAVMLDISLQWVVPAGVLEDPTQQVGTLRPTTSHTGRSYPRSYVSGSGWSYTPAGAGSTVTVTSSGTIPTPPILRAYGAFTEPVITNLTTGGVIELDAVSVSAGSYLEIDVGARTVLLNGDPSLSYYNKINFATTSWWELQPGANLISMTTGTQDASCELDVLWNDNFS